jgi:carbonic anhydrase
MRGRQLGRSAGRLRGGWRARRSGLAGVFLVCAFVPAQALAWSLIDGIFGERSPEPPPQVAWSYQGETGPAHWADLAPEYAGCRGDSQSPVDLGVARPLLLPYMPLSIHYRSNPLHIVNDGSQVSVRVEAGSYISVAGHSYELTGFHFHVPGEHQVDGVAPDMELHLHHRDVHGKIAILAVPFRAGRRMNSTLSRIWDHIPPDGGSYYNRQVGINPVFLLPAQREYYSYNGSLTQPPCTENVAWFVMRTPVEADTSYLNRLRLVVGGNARPIQPLNGRDVVAVVRR